MHSVLAILFALILGQNPTVHAPTSTEKLAANSRPWEYLVVSFGKTRFANPNLVPELKQIGFSKLLPFAQAGLFSAEEAYGTESDMDRLGKFGWELVNVIGAIGGDQEFIFKRPFDESRSEKEVIAIRAEGERLASLRKKHTDTLVDLDDVERQAAIQKESKLLKEQLGSIPDTKILSIEVVGAQDFKGKFTAAVTVVIDGTADLLHDGNNYRKSEAEKFAVDASLLLVSAGKLERGLNNPLLVGNVEIGITVIVNHAGERKPIAYRRVAADRPWSDGLEIHK